MDLGIAGRVAFVAGGSKGMGRASAELLAQAGCLVGVMARGQADIDETVNAIRNAGGKAMGFSADLSTRDGTRAAVAALEAEFGMPDIVVSMGHDSTLGGFDDVSDESYEEAFRNYTMSTVYLARATVPTMRERKWGRFIHIGSTNGKEPQLSHPSIVGNSVRPSTVAFMRVLAHEVAADGVTVNTVAPGLTITPTLMNYITNKMKITPEQGLDWLAGKDVPGIKGGQGAANVPMRRAGKPEEIGGVVAFLASQYAGYLTGEWIAVDGGRHHFAF
ncbi:SDR family oxidoreductase [Pseudomonas sp. H11T01]|uniref:SDR family oxidoreductase n=1 Tax=Pseudomonas sp. H11T01 TaxID=3402749 RepID=UPI003AD01038